MKRRDRRRTAALVLSAALIAPAFAFSALDAGQRQLLAPLEDTWNELDEAIRGNLQAQAGAVVQRYGALDLPADAVFKVMLKYAVSEDGALHAEKYYQTVWDEFHRTRSAFRWRHLIGLARVTASEYGRPAPGQAEARDLLGVG